MNALIRKTRGTFNRIRNSPLFFIPLLLVGGYALASFAYTHIMNDTGPRQVIAAARVAAMNSGYVESPPARLRTAINEAPLEWKPDNPHQVISDVNVASSKIYFFESKNTRDYFTSIGEDYDLTLKQWHYYFNFRGVKYIDIQNADLIGDKEPGILILPSAVALSLKERAAIRAFENKGGGVLATWATGARNEKGELLGNGFLQEQFGINIAGEIAAQDNEKFLIVSGETPVAFSLPAGSRIWLGNNKIQQHPLRVSGGDKVAGRFLDAVRTPGTADKNEAIVYAERGSSRRVYFAFAETSWRFQQADIYRLLDDVFNWLQRRPGAYLANWPYPYRAAQIVEMDTEQDFTNAINLSDMLDSHGFEGTFYCLTSVASKYPDIVSRLEHKHEIAYHGDIHDAFKGQPREIQSRRLDTMQLELRPLVNAPSRLRGFRPPYELADQVVESLLFDKGFGHILPNSDGTEAMLPYLSPVSPRDFRSGLIVLPRTQRDDMNFIGSGLSSEEIAATMKKDFDQAYEYGALGILSVHSQNFQPDSPVAKAMTKFLAHVQSSRGTTWITSSETVESWWRERALLKSKLTGSRKRLVLNIKVEKPGLRRAPSLVILNPVRGLHPEIKINKVGRTQPELVPLDDYRTAIVFNALEPGDYVYYLSYQTQ